MALLKCPDCEHDVSDQAEMCPGCGYPVSKIKEAAAEQEAAMQAPKTCQQCGHEIHTVSGVCENCGAFPGMAHGYAPREKWYKCPKCDKLVGANESQCKNCGEHVTTDEFKRQDDEKLKKWKSDSSGGIMAFVFLVLILAGGLYFIGAFDSPYKFNPPAPASPKEPPKASTRPDVGTEYAAYLLTKDFVREHLKAPRTAKFPGMSEAQIQKVDSLTFIVRSYVDSQNAFGVMIRTRYRAKVMFMGNTRWKLLDLQTE